jgi:FKBP-type peptidyl-prolyl cis-trans isomerase FkpA
MTRTSLGVLLLGVIVSASACTKPSTPPSSDAASSPPASMSEDEKAIYALGAAMGGQIAQQVKPLNLKPAESELLQKAVAAAMSGQKSEYKLEQYGPRLQARAQEQAATVAAEEKSRSASFRAAAEKEPGAVKTASGLVYRELQGGSGPSPKATDRVRVHYQGTLTDGTVFDSSRQRGQPVEFALNGVIPCWTEGLQKMRVGGLAKLVCPSEIAYGDQGRPPTIPGGATLVFEVELLSINPRGPAK